ncbi:hypothetical protein BaRGS_00009095 [Batillaria attramentaria]|uniref:Uncharacterized protein n=1 Tax=Batillaria attramentaria TaxID=370345 RepID=A0ABD0LJR4_9CAEN
MIRSSQTLEPKAAVLTQDTQIWPQNNCQKNKNCSPQTVQPKTAVLTLNMQIRQQNLTVKRMPTVHCKQELKVAITMFHSPFIQVCGERESKAHGRTKKICTTGCLLRNGVNHIEKKFTET